MSRVSANQGLTPTRLPSKRSGQLIVKCLTHASLLGLALLSGCIRTQVFYHPDDHSIVVERHNHIFMYGPCGAPWNYDDYYSILLTEGQDRCETAQLEIYGPLKFSIKSGYVAIDRASKKVTIGLILLGLDEHLSEVLLPFEYNGTYKYIEQPLPKGSATREWLQKFSGGKRPDYYIPRKR